MSPLERECFALGVLLLANALLLAWLGCTIWRVRKP